MKSRRIQDMSEIEFGESMVSLDDDFIKYNPEVGVEACHIRGLPGTGKSNIAIAIVRHCLKRGEHFIMPGDRFCEWRHFLLDTPGIEVKVIVPNNGDIFYHPEWVESKDYIHKRDYSKLNVISEFNEAKPTVLAVYDQMYLPKDRAMFFAEIMEQLVNRTKFLDVAIGMLFHEAGVYFKQQAQGEHWKAVDKFGEFFVDCRKGLVRPILLSQLENEIEYNIRAKCMFSIHKQGVATKNQDPKLREAIPFTKIDEYQISKGGLYNRYNKHKESKENKIIMKMIPRGYIARVPNPSIQDDIPFEVVTRKHNGTIKYCLINKATKTIVKWLGEVVNGSED